MCLSKPKIPAPTPVQEQQAPDFTAMARAKRKSGATAGGTLLTAPSGIDLAAGNSGAPTLLGG
jgi:hypothetical protein